MKQKSNENRDTLSVRSSRNVRQLQSAVHRYLDDCGSWADNVGDVLRELFRLTRDAEIREKLLAQRESALSDRERAVDELLLKLAPNLPRSVVPPRHSFIDEANSVAAEPSIDAEATLDGISDPPVAAVEQHESSVEQYSLEEPAEATSPSGEATEFLEEEDCSDEETVSSPCEYRPSSSDRFDRFRRGKRSRRKR